MGDIITSSVRGEQPSQLSSIMPPHSTSRLQLMPPTQNMLTISKNLLWPRDLESLKGGNFNTLSLVDCYVQICNGTVV
jgi:hypothetical protein